MYAIVRIAGSQHVVSEGETLTVPRLEAEAGSSVRFDDVLLVKTDGEVVIGRPTVPGAAVEATVVGEVRSAKVTSFKFIRRENYRRRKGHRQPMTRIRVTRIDYAPA
uniref:Large ribosomal subunit protein bL21 n=1 Tax=candidate division WOR-3 bacterium TaxID=2052148 RepID=A0A7C4GJN3_UNCW3